MIVALLSLAAALAAADSISMLETVIRAGRVQEVSELMGTVIERRREPATP